MQQGTIPETYLLKELKDRVARYEQRLGDGEWTPDDTEAARADVAHDRSCASKLHV